MKDCFAQCRLVVKLTALAIARCCGITAVCCHPFYFWLWQRANLPAVIVAPFLSNQGTTAAWLAQHQLK